MEASDDGMPEGLSKVLTMLSNVIVENNQSDPNSTNTTNSTNATNNTP